MERKIYITREPVDATLKKQLVEYVYNIIGCMYYVHENMGPGLHEYCYQEALNKKLKEHFSNTHKEFEFHPVFEGQPLESFVKMDLMIEDKRGNVIVECKSIKEITDKERYQTFGYLRATGFPIALLVNFGTWPKAQIERYYYHDNKIKAF